MKVEPEQVQVSSAKGTARAAAKQDTTRARVKQMQQVVFSPPSDLVLLYV